MARLAGGQLPDFLKASGTRRTTITIEGLPKVNCILRRIGRLSHRSRTFRWPMSDARASIGGNAVGQQVAVSSSTLVRFDSDAAAIRPRWPRPEGCLHTIANCRSHGTGLCNSCAQTKRCAERKAAGLANGRKPGSKNYQYGGVKKSGWSSILPKGSPPSCLSTGHRVAPVHSG